MQMLTTNRYSHNGIPFGRPINNFLRRWLGTSSSTMPHQSIEPNFIVRSSSRLTTRRPEKPQTQVTRVRIPLTNAQIEALELALRQGSVNAPSELFA